MDFVHVIEDRQSLTVISQYVWSLAYIDGLVLRDDNSSGGNMGISGSGLGRRLYAQQDGNWNLTALVDTGGAVRERFVYDPYGNVQALDAGGTSGTDGYGWAYLHQGGRLEPATGLYYFRHRDYSPGMGRWVEEDPIGYGDGMNLYQFVQNSPVIRIDSSGMQAQPRPVPTPVEPVYPRLGPLPPIEPVHPPAPAPSPGVGPWAGAGAALYGIWWDAKGIYQILDGENYIDEIAAEQQLENLTPLRRRCPPKKDCPPCAPPLFDLRIDRVPPRETHWPWPGDYFHIRIQHQNPVTCKCFWGKWHDFGIPQGSGPWDGPVDSLRPTR